MARKVLAKMLEEDDDTQVYKKPWVGLTEEEMWEAVRPLCNHDQIATALVEVSKDEYRAIEAKLREKNA
jgi:hypothetical protein